MIIDNNLFRLDGKVALVTGGSRGIGRALCIGLAAFGADVAVAGISPKTQETVEAVQQQGRRSLFVPTDVHDIRQTRRAVHQTVEQLGRIDIVVNNAGVGSMHPAEDVTYEEWDRVLGINLRGLFFTAQEAARFMIKQGDGGRIINISSIFGIVGSELGASIYHAAKGGVVNLTRALACEWAKYNILVNAIGPGFVWTEMTEPMHDMPALTKLLETRHALGRFGQPEECVGAAVFLASSAASFITGQNLFVDGGYTAY